MTLPTSLRYSELWSFHDLALSLADSVILDGLNLLSLGPREVACRAMPGIATLHISMRQVLVIVTRPLTAEVGNTRVHSGEWVHCSLEGWRLEQEEEV